MTALKQHLWVLLDEVTRVAPQAKNICRVVDRMIDVASEKVRMLRRMQRSTRHLASIRELNILLSPSYEVRVPASSAQRNITTDRKTVACEAAIRRHTVPLVETGSRSIL